MDTMFVKIVSIKIYKFDLIYTNMKRKDFLKAFLSIPILGAIVQSNGQKPTEKLPSNSEALRLSPSATGMSSCSSGYLPAPPGYVLSHRIQQVKESAPTKVIITLPDGHHPILRDTAVFEDRSVGLVVKAHNNDITIIAFNSNEKINDLVVEGKMVVFFPSEYHI
jgi:hypothetical protein